MSVLRVAAVLLGLGAVPVLFVSAETLSSRVRDAADHSVGPENIGRALRTAQAVEPRRQSETPAKADGWRHASLRDGSIAPTFGRVVIDPASASRFEGQSAPGAEVTLSIDGRPLGAARADETGVWRFDLTTPLAAGDHVISLSTTSGNHKGGLPGQDIRIAIPGVLATGALVAYQAPGSDDPVAAPAAAPPSTRESVRKRAEELAAAASQRFTDVIRHDNDRQSAQAPPAIPSPPLRSSQPQTPPSIDAPPPASPNRDHVATPVLEWLERSAREYQSTIVKELSKPSAPGASPQPPRRDGDPRVGFVSAVGDVVADVQIAIQEWLARANRTYQTEIMRKLEQPVSAAAGIAAGPLKPPPVSKSAPPSSASGVKVTDVDVQGPPFDGVRGEEDVRRGGANGTRVVETADRMSTAPIGQGGPVSPPLKDSQPPSADEAGRKRAAEEADARKAEMQRERAADAKRQSGDAARPKATASPGAEETASKRQQDAAAERLASQRSAEEAGRTAGQDRPAEIAGESNAGVAAKSAELARKAVEQASGAPAKRAEQMQVAQPQADVAPRAANHGKSAKAVASKTDDRIAEGSAEKGPVDRPKSKGAVSEGAADAVAANAGDPEAGSHAGRAVIALSPRGRRCARAGQAIRPPGSYVVGSGDTLSEIAERHYGTSRRMWRIVKSNRRKLRDPDFIRTCQRIWLP